MSWALAKPSWGGFPQLEQIEEGVMAKVLAVLALIASFLLVAPGIESGTSGSTQFFQAIGTADGGGWEAKPPPRPLAEVGSPEVQPSRLRHRCLRPGGGGGGRL